MAPMAGSPPRAVHKAGSVSSALALGTGWQRGGRGTRLWCLPRPCPGTSQPARKFLRPEIFRR